MVTIVGIALSLVVEILKWVITDAKNTAEVSLGDAALRERLIASIRVQNATSN